jgi:hypothetical protein
VKDDGGDTPPVEDIVAEFLLEREDGRNPSIDEWLARYPRHAEVLAQLLSDDTASPATLRRPVTAGAGGRTGPSAGAAAGDTLRLGPYDVVAHVSTAGGGTVYRARHREAGHLVALKVLDSRGAIDARDVERFHREAAMLRAMNLVHVVPVLDAGEDRGRSWIAMKWLEGDTFSKLREAASDPAHRLHDQRERARLVARVARTFAAIHSYGILHRDVKPTNIMVDRTGEPMIIDFGIAQAPDLPELTTTADAVMGTPRFLAPELLAGGNRQVSPKTDVYGLGLCLYELCTSAEAFRNEVAGDLFTAIRTTGPVHPRKANPALPPDFAAVILRAIEIDPARRYPDMTAFADDLDRVARGESPAAATLRGAQPLLRAIRRHRARIVAAAILAAVLIPALWMWASHALEEGAARKAETALRPFAWFSPDAFAGGKGVPDGATAAALARNKAATSDRRLLAAWIPFLRGDHAQALENLGSGDDTFAAKLLREHLRHLTGANRGHESTTFDDPETGRPDLNPETGQPFEALVPRDPGSGIARDPAWLAKTVQPMWDSTAIRNRPVDHLVLATVRWASIENDPSVDTSKSRALVLEALAEPVKDDATRVPALHLRGVMRFLSGDWGGARDDFEAVVAAQPAALGTRYLLGIALCRSGDWTKACGALDRVVADLPRDDRMRSKAMGHLALARFGAGQQDAALQVLQDWWTACEDNGAWQDAVVPRVMAARIWRARGDVVAACDLLKTAVREDERFGEIELERQGRPALPPYLFIWEPAVKDLLEVAELASDRRTVAEYRGKLADLAVGLRKSPASPESYLDLNLAGLRELDFRPQRMQRPGLSTKQ